VIRLPVRRWLALAVVLIFAVPALAFAVAGGIQYHNLENTSGGMKNILSSGAPSWNVPHWRRITALAAAPSEAAFTLVRGGKVIYSSRPRIFTAGESLNVQKMQPPGAPSGETAYLYTSAAPWANGPGAFWIFPLVGLTALVTTLGCLAWFFGRTLVRPLMATGVAAQKIAAGGLDIQIPDSRIREVADLKSAFANMSSELGKSLRHQAELEEQRRLFVGAIAHDLRTPLFSLRGYLEGLDKGLASTPAKRREYIHGAREKADALERLVADLFAYARVEYLDQSMEHESVDLADLTRSLVETRAREAGEREIALRISVGPGCSVVWGDRRLIERALDNVLDNALRYSGAGSDISVTLTNEPGISVAVADSGPGISPADMPYVFDPGYRGTIRGGTGLGLAISRRILRGHGGDLTAANGTNGGAVLTLSLPAANPAPQSQTSVTRSQSA